MRRGDIICNVHDVEGWAKGKTVALVPQALAALLAMLILRRAERAAHPWEAGVSMINRTNKCTPTEYVISHCPLVFDVYEVMLESAFRNTKL